MWPPAEFLIHTVSSAGVPSTYESLATEIRSLLPGGAVSPSAAAADASPSTAP